MFYRSTCWCTRCVYAQPPECAGARCSAGNPSFPELETLKLGLAARFSSRLIFFFFSSARLRTIKLPLIRVVEINILFGSARVLKKVLRIPRSLNFARRARRDSDPDREFIPMKNQVARHAMAGAMVDVVAYRMFW